MATKRQAAKEKKQAEQAAAEQIYNELVELGLKPWTLVVGNNGYVGSAGIFALQPKNALVMIAMHAVQQLGYRVSVWKNSSMKSDECWSAQITVLADGPDAFGVGPHPEHAVLKAAKLAFQQLKEFTEAEKAAP